MPRIRRRHVDAAYRLLWRRRRSADPLRRTLRPPSPAAEPAAAAASPPPPDPPPPSPPPPAAAAAAGPAAAAEPAAAAAEPPPPPPAPPPPTVSGLDARPSNTTCIAPARATGSATIGTQRAFPNLVFRSQPVSMQQVPGDSSRWFVVEKLGFVRVFNNNQSVTATSDFIDLSTRVEHVRRMRAARHGVSPRFPRGPARVPVVHQHAAHTRAGRIHGSRNSPRATADSRSIPIPSASSSRSPKKASITTPAALPSAPTVFSI